MLKNTLLSFGFNSLILILVSFPIDFSVKYFLLFFHVMYEIQKQSFDIMGRGEEKWEDQVARKSYVLTW